VSDERFHELVEAYLDDSLAADERQELTALLADPEREAALLAQLAVARQLQCRERPSHWPRLQQMIGAVASERQERTVAQVQSSIERPRGRRRRAVHRRSPPRSRWRLLPILALLAVAAWLWHSGRGQGPVAEVLEGSLHQEDAHLRVGDALLAGRPWRVEGDGYAVLALPDGIRLESRGATRGRLAADRLDLQDGGVSVAVPPDRSLAFTVSSAEGWTAVRGTRFSVYRQSGTMQVALQRGELDLPGGHRLRQGEAAAMQVGTVTVWPAPSAEDLARDLLGHWTGVVQEGRVIDSSPRGLHLRLRGGTGGTGAHGPELRLDGDDSQACGPSLRTPLLARRDHSYAFWFRAERQDQSRATLLSRHGGKFGINIILTGDRLRVHLMAGPEASIGLHATGSWYGRWLHLVVIVDRQAEELRLAVDGLVIARTPLMEVAGRDLEVGGILCLGSDHGGESNAACRLADVRLYGRALDPADIASLAADRGVGP